MFRSRGWLVTLQRLLSKVAAGVRLEMPLYVGLWSDELQRGLSRP
mgnify:CR=1 FL=1|jgi:hypothetical protein